MAAVHLQDINGRINETSDKTVLYVNHTGETNKITPMTKIVQTDKYPSIDIMTKLPITCIKQQKYTDLATKYGEKYYWMCINLVIPGYKCPIPVLFRGIIAPSNIRYSNSNIPPIVQIPYSTQQYTLYNNYHPPMFLIDKIIHFTAWIYDNERYYICKFMNLPFGVKLYYNVPVYTYNKLVYVDYTPSEVYIRCSSPYYDKVPKQVSIVTEEYSKPKIEQNKPKSSDYDKDFPELK